MPDLMTSDGVRLHYLDEGSGPAVVLVAGFTASATSWGLFARDLVAAGHRVVSVDRRCHGASDFPDHGQRISRHAADLEELRRHLELDNAVWIGSSMGASTLLCAADLFGCAGYRGLVFVDQTPRMVNDDTWSLGLYDLIWSSVPDFVAEFPGTLSAFHAPPPEHVLRMLAAAPSPPYPFDQTRGLLLDHALQDWRDVVTRLECPVLAVGGRHSPLWPVASTEWIASHAPRGELAILEDSGHAPHLSEPEVFAKTVLTWLDQLV
jgi:non-heme chloroperoxidase